MTEIEIRGKINQDQFNELSKLLSIEGGLSNHYHRLSIDLSPGFDPVTKTWENSSGTDIRLKKSDASEKISIKTGSFHDLERKEIDVKLETGQFLNALNLLEVLGYKSGMIYFWESWEFNYQGVEVKLSKYTNNYYTFEIEGKQNNNVLEVAQKLELNAYSAQEYQQAINWENQNIHRLYQRELVDQLLLHFK